MQDKFRESSRATIVRIERCLPQLSSRPSAPSIHKFRTQSRRVETILREIPNDAPRYQQKLLKQLSKLRKKTGRVRDLDVQVTMLRNLKVPEAAKIKSRLIRQLLDERTEREREVRQLLDKKTVRDLRKRLKRLKAELQLEPSTDLLSTAKQI